MQRQIEAIEQFVRTELAAEHSGHGFDHIQRVVNNARLIQQKELAADLTTIILAALLHDVIDEKIATDVEQARQKVKTKLTENGIQDGQQTAIFDIIDHMSFSKNLNQHQTLSLEGQIVQDADRLDAIGAIGIGRTFMYGGAHDGVAYDPEIQPRVELTKENYREPSTVINHFYEKLFKLAATMNTQAAREIAQARTDFMHQFVDQYLAEWTGQR
ncbi:HD domain-containing protein [Latilactobacillus curvatus]|uniref:HD domain-containing protein n=1 Tax=Latilactobacillus curvatus TaxID=28038 RepID=UPI0028B28A75|nr:HD domain-containing protein [Latilactobacillus curvatus]MDT7016513.1 HD domain-containing protein [Latilactobacillus curvatus]